MPRQLAQEATWTEAQRLQQHPTTAVSQMSNEKSGPWLFTVYIGDAILILSNYMGDYIILINLWFLDPVIFIHPYDSWDFGVKPGAWGGTLRPHEAVGEFRCCQGIPRRGRWDPTVTVWKKSFEIPGMIKTHPVEVKVVVYLVEIYRYLPRVFTMPWWFSRRNFFTQGNCYSPSLATPWNY